MAKKKKTIKKISEKKISKPKPKLKETKKDLSQLNFCPACASNNLFYNKIRDELSCRDCGEIFSEVKL